MRETVVSTKWISGKHINFNNKRQCQHRHTAATARQINPGARQPPPLPAAHRRRRGSRDAAQYAPRLRFNSSYFSAPSNRLTKEQLHRNRPRSHFFALNKNNCRNRAVLSGGRAPPRPVPVHVPQYVVRNYVLNDGRTDCRRTGRDQTSQFHIRQLDANKKSKKVIEVLISEGGTRPSVCSMADSSPRRHLFRHGDATTNHPQRGSLSPPDSNYNFRLFRKFDRRYFDEENFFVFRLTQNQKSSADFLWVETYIKSPRYYCYRKEIGP